MSAFHSFGLSSELASTLSPSLFQFAFTAHSTFVRHAIHTTANRVFSRLNLIRDIKVRQRNAPILFFFERQYPRSRRACSTRFQSDSRPRLCAESMLAVPKTSSFVSITKGPLSTPQISLQSFKGSQFQEGLKFFRISGRGTDGRQTTQTGRRANWPRRGAHRRTSARPQPTARLRCP